MLKYNLLKNLPEFSLNILLPAFIAVCCFCGCGDPVPPPPTEKAELVIRFFSSIDNKDVNAAMRQGVKLRSLDNHNENIIRLVEIQQCNAYIEAAQKRVNTGDIQGAINILRKGVRQHPENIALREMLPRVRQLRNANALLESMKNATNSIAMRSALTAAKIGFSLNTTPALQKYFAQYEKQISVAEIREKAEAEAKARAAREKAEARAKQEQKKSSKKTPVPNRSSDKKQQLSAEKNLSALKK